MASTYELMERNPMRTDSIACTHVDLELLNKEITQTLLYLGLTDEEARTLLCLNKRGEMRVLEISRSTEILRTRLYSVLESLESKGLVFSTLERPAKFKALPIDKAVDFLIESYKRKLQSFEKAKEVISNDWFLLQENEVIRNTEVVEESLQIISGEEQIYSKAKNLIMQATKEVCVFASRENLAKISHEDITEKLQLIASSGTAVNVLTDLPSGLISLVETEMCKIRGIPPHFNNKVHFIIVDGKELLLLNLDQEEAYAVWSNSRSFIDAMSFLFAVGWRSTSVEQSME